MLNLPQNPKWDIARVSHSTLVNADCFDVFPSIPDKSVDAIIADLPYGTTACKWDSVLPFDKLWEQYNRIIKSNGAICLFGREPFTSAMVMSNPKNYKHKWVWNKKQSGSFQIAKYMPLQIDEDIIVFSNGKCNYYPIMRKGKMRKRGGAKEKSRVVESGLQDGFENYSDMYYPVNIYELANPRQNKLHPTEKPIELMKMLVETYTKENEVVFDNTMGVGSSGLASLMANRQFIGIEKEKQYYDVAVRRLSSYCG
jgi:DNA modification methylase